MRPTGIAGVAQVPMLLEGDAVVLAGATGRVGGATLRELAVQGARVLVISRSRDRAADAIARNLPAEQRERCSAYAADLSDPAAAAGAIDAAVQRFGRIDAAVTLSGRGHFTALRDSTLDDLRENLEGNLIGNYNLLLPALRAMLEQSMPDGALSRGRLVAVSAGSSKDPQPRFGLFGASKAALNVLMQAIAREHKADGIVANSVVLGTVATEAATSYLSADDFAAAAQPEEVARILAFLASRGASGINGALVDVNAREVD